MFSKLKLTVAGAALLVLSGCGWSNNSDGVTNVDPEIVSKLQSEVGDRVFFAYDSSALTEEAKNTLSRQAGFMKEYGNLRFDMEGHSDERGTEQYNLGLGERRANAALKYIAMLDTSVLNRVTVISYGKERPAVEGHDDSSWSQNRRAVLVIRDSAE